MGRRGLRSRDGGAIRQREREGEEAQAEVAMKVASPIDQKYRVQYAKFLDPDGYPALKPPWGTLSAIDLSTGKYVWKIPLGDYRELAAQGLANTGCENYGGPVVTAGGVGVFWAPDHYGKVPAVVQATPAPLWGGRPPPP